MLHFIPVTMDELMQRFVTNNKRQAIKDRFKEDKKILMERLDTKMPEELEVRIRNSFRALKYLVLSNQVDGERFKNSENKLFLKLLDKATNRPEESQITFAESAKRELDDSLESLPEFKTEEDLEV